MCPTHLNPHKTTHSIGKQTKSIWTYIQDSYLLLQAADLFEEHLIARNLKKNRKKKLLKMPFLMKFVCLNLIMLTCLSKGCLLPLQHGDKDVSNDEYDNKK